MNLVPIKTKFDFFYFCNLTLIFLLTTVTKEKEVISKWDLALKMGKFYFSHFKNFEIISQYNVQIVF